MDGPENSRLIYKLLAGNSFSLIKLYLNGTLIFDHWDDAFLLQQDIKEYLNNSIVSFSLIISVEDNGVPKRFNWIEVSLIVDLLIWSGTAPFFPIPVYRKFVMKNSPLRKTLFEVKAVNRLTNVLNLNWQYSLDLEMANFKVFFNLKLSFKGIGINETTAEIFLEENINYESISKPNIPIEFTVLVEDKRGRKARTIVQIYVVERDEFVPIFKKTSYTFQVNKILFYLNGFRFPKIF